MLPSARLGYKYNYPSVSKCFVLFLIFLETMLMTAFLSLKMHGYAQFSFLILIVLAKIPAEDLIQYTTSLTHSIDKENIGLTSSSSVERGNNRKDLGKQIPQRHQVPDGHTSYKNWSFCSLMWMDKPMPRPRGLKEPWECFTLHWMQIGKNKWVWEDLWEAKA